MPKSGAVVIVPMPRDKDCKGSVRYALPKDSTEIVTNAYVGRAFAEKMPAHVVVVVIPVPAGASFEEIGAKAAELLKPLGA